jgi:DNA-binding LacI/PurR family transcriptional regulator
MLPTNPDAAHRQPMNNPAMSRPQKPNPQPEQSSTSTPPETGRRRVQMTDIARLAGVSASTVSRALNGSPLIPEATRSRIIELARSLNYRVNVGAANLRKRDVQTVGVMFLGESMQMISHPFLLSLLGTVADAVDERGMSLLLTRLRHDSRDQMTAMIDNGQVAGLIVIGQLTWHDHLNEVVKRGLPMAVWGACLPDARYPVVGGDNDRGGYVATRHLIDQGSRRIAFFGDIAHPETGLRYQGYARALDEAGITIDPRLQQSFLFGDARIRETIDHWLDLGLEFDAIFASSDVTAIAIMGALSERGIAVPGQVRIVGYDDIALAAQVHPSLTSIHQPADTAGHALVDLLFEATQGAPARQILLPAELVVRESSR